MNLTRNSTIAIIIAVMLFYVFSCVAQVIHIHKPYYTTHYNLGMKCPSQVSWTLRAHDLGSVKRKPSWSFAPDIPDSLAVVRSSDYNRSGYHRGHLCPAADRSATEEAMLSTFAMSNIAPQAPALNTGFWVASERWCRQAALLYDSVQVLVVPIFLDRDTLYIGRHTLGVPHAFFKAVWLPKNDSIINHWFIWNK